MSAKSNIAKLPEQCYIVNPRDGRFNTDAPIVCIKAGEAGFYPVAHPSIETAEEAATYAARWNETYGALPHHIAAMTYGSCFGWEVPLADCDNPIHDGATA